ncbi:MAG: bifunctional diaminohydroxyphosphoribosylaminopyrimidine deaminase/5-amino-6-(5-phosphoribosylamino)uracil reductase RibD [Proteobacteria bacterium]|nr:bifunctional diaminohydroxyphosphoribosylaminopyrimidine deaminase/5-amino-6-(5-phosphoribosylamino)uracil reductase RibD [Pseudomonadota bacterium]
MAAALRLAGDGLGRVWPNPAVGCLIIKDDKTVGRGWTQPGGRPHAEFEALQMAGAKAKGATAYVTLEPCAHQGETRSCARLLAQAGVKRVVFAVSDPDPRTAGKGAEIMKKAGVQVDYGLLEEEAKALNKGYFLKQTEGRPLVAMKLATSKDGKIAEREGVETRITGRQAREYSHRLRASHDAILVGIGTVLADDPDLTCRLPDKDVTSPVRIVLDTKLKIPLDSRLVQSAHEVPVWVVTEETEISPELAGKGVEIVSLGNIKNIKQVLELIAKKGITRLLVEGGAKINTSFHESALVDQIYRFSNNRLVLGSEAVPAFRKPKILRGSNIEGFQLLEKNILGKDILDFYERRD